jgi:hypothetical protein
MQKGVYKDVHWVVDYLESKEYYDHAPHVKVINYIVFQVPINFYQGPTENQGESPMGGC